MSHISDPYTITTLPRINLQEGVKECTIAEVVDRDVNHVDLGISGSMVGTFILRPTPRLVWSHAISPSVSVTALATHEVSGNCKRSAVGLLERKKYKLNLIERSESVLKEPQDGERALIRDRAVAVPHEVAGLKISANGKLLYCLSANGNFNVYNFSVEEDGVADTLEPVYSLEATKRTKVVYHKFINDIIGAEMLNVEGYLLTVESSTAKYHTVKLLALLNNNEVAELHQATIQTKTKNYRFEYDPAGNLLAFDCDTLDLSVYALPSLKLVKTVALANRVKDLAADLKSSTVAVPAPNRLLLTVGNTVLLIDTKFEAVLSTFVSTRASSVRILGTPGVKGNSFRTRETILLVLSTDKKDGLTSVQNLTCDVGLGTLSECLGKGVSRIQKKSQSDEEFFQNEVVGLPSLVADDEDFFESSKALKGELFQVFKELKAAKAAQDVEKWEKIFVSYCKGLSLKDILNNTASLQSGKQDFQVFELEKDRIIDARFFYKVASLIFAKNEEKQITLLSKEFVPEKTLTYLLTHPLFPMEFSNGLLQSLGKFPRLVRQAIVTCPNLSCFELIQQLNLIDNEDIFKDLIVRLGEDYSSEKITAETRRIMSTNSDKRRKSLQAGFDLDKIISTIIKLNFGFEILNSFIDSNGLILSLHYAKNENELDRLTLKISNKINSLLINSQLLTLVDQSLVNAVEFGGESKSKKKKSRAKQVQAVQHQQMQQMKLKPLTISEDIDDTRVKLDSMLSIDKNKNVSEVLLHTKHNNVVDQLNKKVPSYSVDKLIL